MVPTVAPGAPGPRDIAPIRTISAVGRLAMQDLAAERALLAAMLHSAPARSEAILALGADDLERVGHAEIFASMVALGAAGDEVDAESVAGAVRDRCSFTETSWPGFTAAALAAVDDLQHVTAPDSVTLAIQRITTCAELRSFAAAAAAVVKLADECAADPAEEAARALQRARMLLLTAGGTGPDRATWSDLVASYGADVAWRHERAPART